MEITDVQIDIPTGYYAPDDSRSNLLACYTLIMDDELALHCVKLIQGERGPFVAMPAEKKQDHCPRCHSKNHCQANFCSNCGLPLDKERYLKIQPNSKGQIKLYNDIVHPLTVDLRQYLLEECLDVFDEEKRYPGTYRPRRLEKRAV